jgi:hypothetical protein
MATQTQVVILDTSGNKHIPLVAGDKIDRSVLDLAVGSASFNPITNYLTLTFADGSTVAVNIGTLAADKFLNSSSYNSGTHELILNMSDGSTYTVPLADLIPVQANNSITASILGDGSAGSPLQVDVKISANAGNQLSAAVDGLFVPAANLTPATALAHADDGTVTTKSISNSGGVAQVLLGDPAGWATIAVGGVAKRIPYWD